MNQKRFLTLLPIFFIVLMTYIILAGYAFYQLDKYGCIGSREFKDTEQGLDFSVDCQWSIELNTDLDNRTYGITLKHQSATVEIVRVTGEDMAVTLNEGDRFVELDNGVKRFREEDASTYYYDEFNTLSEKFQFQISTTPNEESLDYVDSVVIRIMH